AVLDGGDAEARAALAWYRAEAYGGYRNTNRTGGAIACRYAWVDSDRCPCNRAVTSGVWPSPREDPRRLDQRAGIVGSTPVSQVRRAKQKRQFLSVRADLFFFFDLADHRHQPERTRHRRIRLHQLSARDPERRAFRSAHHRRRDPGWRARLLFNAVLRAQ